MTRIALALVLTGLLIAPWLLATGLPPADPGPRLEPAAAAAAACPVRLDRTSDGKVTVASTIVSPARATVGAGGTVVTDVLVDVDDAGGGAADFGDLTVGGTAGVYLEFGFETSAAAAVTRGVAGVSATSCTPVMRSTSVIVGASTRNGETLELVLVNPYGSDAVINVESSSELGADSASALSSVVVPARSTVVRNLAGLLPLRNRLNLTLSPIRGQVHAFVEGGGRGDRVVIEQVTPSNEWISPVPVFDGLSASLVIASVSPIDVAVRIDAWSEGERTEGLFADVIPARGQLEIPLSDFTIDMVQLFADGPVGAAIVVDGEANRGASPANQEALPEWLMPGPGSTGSSAWISVPGEEDGVVEFQSLRAGGESFMVEVAAGRMTRVPLDDQLIGYTIRANVPIAVIWSVSDATGVGLGTPVPLRGGV